MLRTHAWRRVVVGLVLATGLVAPVGAQTARADLSRLVVVGDSISAGYLNSSLLDRQQVHGYASLVAEQADASLALPLIAEPGVPPVFQLISVDPLVIERAAGASSGRTDPFLQATNLAVPGHTVHDALWLRPDFPIDSPTDLVLGLPGLLGGVSLSQVEWAEALAPTTIIVWIGSMDALIGMLYADSAYLTPVPAFKADYEELMSRLSATGATIIVANIPDVTVLPYLVSTEQIAAQTGLPASVLEAILGIGLGDYVILDGLPLIEARLVNPALGPLPGNVVVTATELAVFQPTIDAYNEVIADTARSNGAALVDAHTLLLRLQARGFVTGGRRLTTDLLGGLFSLDGIHPTYTAHAILANEFIHALNTAFDAQIDPIPVNAVADEDPLVLPGIGRPPAALGMMNPETAASIRQGLLR